MTVAIVLLAAVVVLLLVLQYRERGQWAQERHALLNRIQHPTVYQPPGDVEPAAVVEPEPDQLALVGGVFDDVPAA